MYKVIKYFTDLLDDNRPYEVGDVFPHKECSYLVSDERLAELAGDKNKQGVPLIAQEAAPKRGRKPAEK